MYKKKQSLLNFVNIYCGKQTLCLLSIMLILPACDPATIAVSGVVLTHIQANRSLNGFQGTAKDNALAIKIRNTLISSNQDVFSKVIVCVKHSRVLIIATLCNQEQEQYLKVLLTKKYPKTNIDYEILNTKLESSYATDSLITSNVKSALICCTDIHACNYNITTVGECVYIIGTALTSEEKKTLMEKVSKVSGVKKVIMYVEVKGSELSKENYSDLKTSGNSNSIDIESKNSDIIQNN